MKRPILIGLVLISLAAWGAVEFGDIDFLGDIKMRSTLVVGDTAPDSSSAFEIQSTTKGSKACPEMNEAQRDAISSPATGICIYNSDTNELNYFNGTQWSAVGAGGSGVGGVTYWDDFEADDSSLVSEDADYTTYTGTPDGSASNLTASSETTNQLSGSASYNLNKGTANASGQAWVLEATAPDRLSTVGGETLNLTFNYETSEFYDNSSSGNQVSIYLYDGSNLSACNTRDILSGSFTNAVPVAPDGGQFQCAFTASGATQLDVIFAVTGTDSTNGFVLTVDRIKIGPDATFQAPIVTKWAEFTPTTSGFGTISAANFEYRRVGDSLEMRGNFTTGTVTATEAQVSLPTGLTISKTDSQTGPAGSYLYSTNTGNNGGVILITDGDSFLNFSFVGVFGDAASNPLSPANGNGTANSGSRVSFSTSSIKIAEWSQANAVLSTTQADKQVMIARIYKTSNQSVTSSNPTAVSWQAVDIDTHGMANVSNNRIDILQDGTYLLNMQFRMSGANNNGFTAQIAIDGTGTYVGAQSGGSGNTVGPGITAIAELTAGQQVSAIIDSNSDTSYTVNAGIGNSYLSVTRIPDFSTFSTYGPYEYLEAEVTANTQTDSATSTDVTGASLIISAGTWLLCYSVELQLTNSTGSTTSVEGRLELTDSSNALIENISSRAFLELGNGDLHIQHHDVCGVHTTTASKTVKLRVNNGTGTTNEFARVNDADPNTQSLIKARRLK